MIRISSTARRYATVLIELCQLQKVPDAALDTALDSLNAFNKVIKASKDLQDIIRNPMVRKSETQGTIAKLGTAIKLDEVTLAFLDLVAQKRRLIELEAITAAYQEEIEKRRSTIVAEVQSSHMLNKTQVSKLEKILQAKTGCDVSVVLDIVPNLIGGIVIKLGSCLIDASIKTRLTKMKHLLERVPNETASS